MPIHSIHLGNAWEPPTAERGHWLRRFGRPAGLTEGDRVLLVCDRPMLAAAMMLNGTALQPAGRADGRVECDVTGLLGDRNELVVPLAGGEVPPATSPTGRLSLPEACGRIGLEIVSPD